MYYNIGDEVQFIGEDDNIPCGVYGVVVFAEDQDNIHVRFENVYHNNRNKEKDVWLCCSSNLVKLRESTQKALDNPTLTIPIISEVEYFRGNFEDSEGQVYSVHVEKIPRLVKSKV